MNGRRSRFFRASIAAGDALKTVSFFDREHPPGKSLKEEAIPYMRRVKKDFKRKEKTPSSFFFFLNPFLIESPLLLRLRFWMRVSNSSSDKGTVESTARRTSKCSSDARID